MGRIAPAPLADAPAQGHLSPVRDIRKIVDAGIDRRTVLAGAGGALLAALARPAVSLAATPGADAADVGRIEDYLNGIRTLKARFVQTASTGSYAEGMVYIQRPGRMRLDYAPPAELQIYADGTWLIMVDEGLREVNQLPLSATPASVLVADEVRLGGKIAVTRIERGAQTLRVHLTQAEEPEAGTLILTFADAPLALRQWSVIDAQGVTTRVALLDAEFNGDIPRRVLTYVPPDWSMGFDNQ
ncbi:MAG: outer membrane lipoprotein carrier protein LolA [Alphaproteobacteria bacterium]|nr:outer membrane lipoprotein carrier protein LolA [Alphaproteobacteria bacterium]